MFGKKPMEGGEGIGAKFSREDERDNEKPTLTVYVLRHGQTEEDKTKPNRGLTEMGEKQIIEAADALIRELDPDTDIIQLLDSNTPRTKACNKIIGQRLEASGFKFFHLIKRDKAGHPLQDKVTTSDQIVETKGTPRVKLSVTSNRDSELERNPEQRTKYNIPDTIKDPRLAVWYALGSAGELSPDTETPEQVANRMEQGVELAKKDLPLLTKLLNPGQRIVTIINANAPQIDALITKKTGKSVLERGGGVKNAEGLKIDFSITDDKKDGVKTTFEEWPN